MARTMFIEMQADWGFNRMLFGKLAQINEPAPCSGTGLVRELALQQGSYFGQWRAPHKRTGWLCIGRCLEAGSLEPGVLVLGISEPVQVLGMFTKAAHIKLARRWIASSQPEQLQDEVLLREAILWLSVGRLAPQRMNP